jgi:hypothetical protein
VAFVVGKAALEQVFSEYFGSLANYCTECSALNIHGWYNRPVVTSVIVDSVPLHPKKEKRVGLQPHSCLIMYKET